MQKFKGLGLILVRAQARLKEPHQFSLILGDGPQFVELAEMRGIIDENAVRLALRRDGN